MDPSRRNFRYGVGMMLAGLLSAVGGAVPIPTSVASRAMFLFFGVVMALVGAYYIDRSNRNEKRQLTRHADKDSSSL